jgi:hypothetical protein
METRRRGAGPALQRCRDSARQASHLRQGPRSLPSLYPGGLTALQVFVPTLIRGSGRPLDDAPLRGGT